MSKAKPKLAIVMAGGGSRAAYQVGVLKAIGKCLKKGAPSPFSIICGTSAGAINAAGLAARADHYNAAVRQLNLVWSNFTSDKVFRTDVAGITKTGAHWLMAMLLGGLGKHGPMYLLDRKPLRKLLERYLDNDVYQAGIEVGVLDALSVSASGYSSHQSVAFFHGRDGLKNWKRAQRIGVASNITIDHLMASSAIPFLFAPQKINREYFGDGSMRQTAPISPALHLGAERILVIGNRMQKVPEPQRVTNPDFPTLGEIAGHALDSIFLDSLDADIERLQRINRTVGLIDENEREKQGITLRQVDVQVIYPSQNLGALAQQHAHELPWTLRILMRSLGAYSKNNSSLLSYLLFEQGYCRALIDLGYKDTLDKREEIEQLLVGVI
ncbi:MAG: patatin-like phospholipase family protein [Porticoccus sp.]|nr:patatin-like phospholipase family protein [Porticoccus sp.]